MPKYYCMTGDAKAVLDAKNEFAAGCKFLSAIIESKSRFAWFVFIGEQGFSPENMSLLSCIPALKRLGHLLPPDDMLLGLACSSLGVKENKINDEFIDWLLNGEESKKDVFGEN